MIACKLLIGVAGVAKFSWPKVTVILSTIDTSYIYWGRSRLLNKRNWHIKYNWLKIGTIVWRRNVRRVYYRGSLVTRTRNSNNSFLILLMKKLKDSLKDKFKNYLDFISISKFRSRNYLKRSLYRLNYTKINKMKESILIFVYIYVLLVALVWIVYYLGKAVIVRFDLSSYLLQTGSSRSYPCDFTSR